MPRSRKEMPDDWNPQDKFSVIMEPASMNEAEIAEYYRAKGLYPEQLKRWLQTVYLGVLLNLYRSMLLKTPAQRGLFSVFAPEGGRVLTHHLFKGFRKAKGIFIPHRTCDLFKGVLGFTQ